MPHPLVVSVRHTKKFDMYCGRTCYGYVDKGWGNQFRTGTREERIAGHRRHVLTDALLIQLIRQTLRGKVLACWCAPQDCHTDILAIVANSTKEELFALLLNELGPKQGQKIADELEQLEGFE